MRKKLSHKLWQRFTRAAGTTFLLSMPIGYLPESKDSTDLYVGVHGGAGQVVAVLRDCNGEPLSSVAVKYSDVGGSASWPVHHTPLVLGLSGGGWFAKDADIEYGWINPSLSIEGRDVGFGIGYVGGDFPQDFGNLSEPDHVRYSGHLRLGSPRSFYIRVGVAESTPLISGGGLWDAGFGFPVGSKVDLYSAFSTGFYDQSGFAQHARFRLSRHFDLTAAVRVGQADNQFEGSAAAGLIVGLGR